ncbi:hypothetical protein Taro_047874 [Colocasia esculenta]|uniref:Uncharacterized protein n=1 Tax=Colocasia esculenta TaxID=4460 RepID=A0A843X4G6_COLES|nr:hypothetical protein [Colocasia esculenta]
MDAEELAAGRDHEAMENYAEQIAVTSCLVYVNEGVHTPIAEGWHPTSPQAPEKRPLLICLKRKSRVKVVSKKATQPVAEEEAEEAEEEEEMVEQSRPQAVIEMRPLSKEGVFSELGLVVVSDQSDESSSEERVGASTPQGPIVGRTEAVAAAGASNTVAVEQTVAAGEVVTAQGSTSVGTNESVHAVEVPKGAMVPHSPHRSSCGGSNLDNCCGISRGRANGRN